jgi:hypothetical protein
MTGKFSRNYCSDVFVMFCIPSRACGNHRAIISKYHLGMCRRCFRANALAIGFKKVSKKSLGRVQFLFGPCFDAFVFVLHRNSTTKPEVDAMNFSIS